MGRSENGATIWGPSFRVGMTVIDVVFEAGMIVIGVSGRCQYIWSTEDLPSVLYLGHIHSWSVGGNTEYDILHAAQSIKYLR